MIDHEREAVFKRLFNKHRSFWLMDLGLIETAWISSSDFVLYFKEKHLSQLESYWISAGYNTGKLDGI